MMPFHLLMLDLVGLQDPVLSVKKSWQELGYVSLVMGNIHSRMMFGKLGFLENRLIINDEMVVRLGIQLGEGASYIFTVVAL